jgi:hypothetical protein
VRCCQRFKILYNITGLPKPRCDFRSKESTFVERQSIADVSTHTGKASRSRWVVLEPTESELLLSELVLSGSLSAPLIGVALRPERLGSLRTDQYRPAHLAPERPGLAQAQLECVRRPATADRASACQPCRTGNGRPALPILGREPVARAAQLRGLDLHAVSRKPMTKGEKFSQLEDSAE